MTSLWDVKCKGDTVSLDHPTSRSTLVEASTWFSAQNYARKHWQSENLEVVPCPPNDVQFYQNILYLKDFDMVNGVVRNPGELTVRPIKDPPKPVVKELSPKQVSKVMNGITKEIKKQDKKKKKHLNGW